MALKLEWNESDQNELDQMNPTFTDSVSLSINSLRFNTHTTQFDHVKLQFSGFQHIHRDVYPQPPINFEIFSLLQKEIPPRLAITPKFPSTPHPTIQPQATTNLLSELCIFLQWLPECQFPTSPNKWSFSTPTHLPLPHSQLSKALLNYFSFKAQILKFLV